MDTSPVETITRLKATFGCHTGTPLPVSQVRSAVAQLGLGPEFEELYSVANGLGLDWFVVLPIYDPSNPKTTWDSLQRANDQDHSKHQIAEMGFLDRFTIFAEIGGGAFAACERSDGSIWYEEDGELHQTDLSLWTFIETCLWEVADLS
ncbi:MAG: hypothetical protein QNJ67_09785 [Kiloniellales bacterium]|nr:hypothetical protein [Kiloniellales bacterium]